MTVLALLPFALGETWFAVFGGLIPIVGLAMIGIILWRAAQPPEDQKRPGGEDDEEPPT
jgi:hypothetical protein